MHIFLQHNQRVPSPDCEMPFEARMPLEARPQDQEFDVGVNEFQLLLKIKLYSKFLLDMYATSQLSLFCKGTALPKLRSQVVKCMCHD